MSKHQIVHIKYVKLTIQQLYLNKCEKKYVFALEGTLAWVFHTHVCPFRYARWASKVLTALYLGLFS